MSQSSIGAQLFRWVVLLLWVSTAKAEEKSTVAFLFPLSGNYSAIGEDNRRAVEIATSVASSAPELEIVYADSKADALTSVSEFRRLVQVERIPAVFAMRGPVGMAVNPISLSLGIPLLGGVGDKNFAAQNKFAFQFWPKSDEEGAFLGATLIGHTFRRIALVTSQDDWTDAVSDGLREKLKAEKLQLVFDQEILPNDTGFRSIVARMKASNPDVVVVNLGLTQIGLFLRQAKEQALNATYYSNFWISKKDVVESAGKDIVEGVRFVEMNTNLPTLRREMQQRYNAVPSGATLSAYAGTLLLYQAAKQFPNIRTPAEWYQALLAQKEIQTPDGSFPIRDRCVQFPLGERVMHEGVSVPLETLTTRPQD